MYVRQLDRRPENDSLVVIFSRCTAEDSHDLIFVGYDLCRLNTIFSFIIIISASIVQLVLVIVIDNVMVSHVQ